MYKKNLLLRNVEDCHITKEQNKDLSNFELFKVAILVIYEAYN